MKDLLFYAVPAMGIFGLLYTMLKFNWVSKQPAGNDRMKEISTYISEGAMAFLKAEWKILGYFVVIVALLLGFMATKNEDSHWTIAVAFVIGAVFSATAGYIGMKVATKANVRTAEAAKTSLSKALNVSFTGGSVMGLGVSGLAVLGLGGLYLILKQYFYVTGDPKEMLRTIEVLTGFSLGAESIALFARVGGGIYTKAADVGADLVGKLEAGQQFAPYPMAGILLNTFFSQGLLQAANSIAANGGVLTKVSVPPKIFAFAAALAAFINFLIGLIPLAVVVYISGQTLSLTFPLVLIIGLFMAFFTAGIGLTLSVIFIRFEESVRGSDAFVLQSHSAPVNKQIMEQLIMVDALKRASAKRITVILPFYGYARQDKKHRGREPISARLMADLFKTAGADRLMCVDLHTSQIQGFFDGPVDHLFALPLLTNYVGSKVDRKNLVIVSPDSGRVRVAERWSELLGGCSIAFIHKTRDPKVPNEATVGKVVGDVKGMTCVVIDDMIDTAGTVTKAVDALIEEGAKDVIIAATHAVLSGPAVDRLKKSRVSEVVVTNTLPISEENRFDNLTVLSIAPLLARAIKEVFEDGSVTSLFDGHS